MKVLGAILAGGKSKRFGSDKAIALLNGMPLIDHVAGSLSTQCDEIIVVGRNHNGYRCIEDRPAPDMGPLAGLAGAMHYAQSSGFEYVLSMGVDIIHTPSNLREMLEPAPAYVLNCQIIGLWPVTSLEIIDDILSSTERHSMLHFIELLGARGVTLQTAPSNINTPADLLNLGQPQ
jgi:molybdenum cofactor guanylyltransferase